MFIVVVSLTLFGILMVYEASSIYAYRMTEDPAFFFKKQLLFFLCGVGIFFAALFLDLDFLRRYSREFLLFTLFLLLAVLIFGERAGGAKRWFHLGWFNFQPAELLKISFLLYCVEYFRRKKALIRSLSQGLLPLGIVVGCICAAVILQPDLGTALFWIVWVFLMLFLYRARSRHLIVIIVGAFIILSLLVFLSPYRLTRITAYFDPFADPKGSGFQLIQSQIAYGEGGIFGTGLGEGKQKLFFLPAAHTDFIFSIIAEEFGLIGSVSVLCVFFFILHLMYRIAQQSRESFRKGILEGIFLIFALEAVINIGVSCGFFPTKGMPLPFVSYGGSNLIVHYMLLGIFFNASRTRQKGNGNETRIGYV